MLKQISIEIKIIVACIAFLFLINMCSNSNQGKRIKELENKITVSDSLAKVRESENLKTIQELINNSSNAIVNNIQIMSLTKDVNKKPTPIYVTIKNGDKK